jgi:hypothetical protein
MRTLLLPGLAFVALGCGGATAAPAQTSPSTSAPMGEPTVSTIVRTRLPKETPCGEGDVCGHFFQVISPGAEPGQLADHALKLVRGHCAGAIIVYRDKKGVMGSGPVFATAEEKKACQEALGRAGDHDDYPSAAVWRKAD